MMRSKFPLPILTYLIFLCPGILLAQQPDNSVAPEVTPRPLPLGYASGTKINAVRTWEPQQAMTNPALVIGSTNVSQVRQTTSYFDGLGRPIQSVARGIAPGEKDLVVPTLYDPLGRSPFTYLSYVSGVTGGTFKANPFAEQQAFFQNLLTSEKNNKDNIFYGESIFEGERAIKVMAAGSNWSGSGRGLDQQFLANVSEDGVRIWQVAVTQGAIPTTSSVYLPGQLTKSVVIDEAGKTAIIFMDKTGQVIMKKIRAAAGDAAGHDGWLCTYYVYDIMGQMRMILPPKATEWLKDNSWNLSNANFRKELCFTYEYDKRGRVIKKQAPGTEAHELVYDSRDRLVLSRDGQLRAAGNNQWLATIFDDLNRPVITGLYTTTQSHQQLQDAMNVVAGTISLSTFIPGPQQLILDKYTDGVTTYQAQQSVELVVGFETSLTSVEISVDPNVGQTEVSYVSLPLPGLSMQNFYALTYTYYDNHNFPGAHSSNSTDFSRPQAGTNANPDPVSVSSMTYGAITGTKVRVLDTDQWLTTTRYYDDKGRVVQTIEDGYKSGKNVTTQMYDFAGKLLSTYQHLHYPVSSTTPNTMILTTFSYDHAGRMTKIGKQLNDNAATYRDIATLSYNPLGQLAKKELKKSGGVLLESLEYTYNVRGWLKSINRKYLDPVNPEPHFFGMELHYDYGFTNKEYNGNISGMTWKGNNAPEARSYAFTYDRTNRLLQANYTQLAGSQWNQTAADFSVKLGDGQNYTQAFDPNGNIKRLQQYGMKGSNTKALIDDLTYTYNDPLAGAQTNKLQRVVDAVNDPASTLGDFVDHNAAMTIDYEYDGNGNMVKDQNKKISAVQYNFLNLPRQVSITGKGTISFVYDALGRKLAKTVVDQTNTTTKTTRTDYRNGLIFENDELEIVNHEEGRIRVVRNSGQPIAFYYDYFLKDHLGNIRTVLTEQSDLSMYMATMETENAPVETNLFSNVDASRMQKPVGFPDDNTTTKNESVARLNGDNPDKRIGPSLVLKVMAGDTIHLGVKAFFKSASPNNKGKSTVPAADMAAALLRAFGGTGNAAEEGSHNLQGANTTAGPMNEAFAAGSWNRLKERETKGPDNATRPKAYLNFALFDEQFNLVEKNSGVKQVAAMPDELQTLGQQDIVMERSGFLYVYTSNETPQDVYFDNLFVALANGPVLEETHYYPYGLQMAGISTRAPNRLRNKYLFNGKEAQREEFADGTGLEWYDYGNREYDPQIGRFFKVDPLAHEYSELTPYQYAGNDPIKNVDLDGLEPKMALESWDMKNARAHTYEDGQKVFLIEGYWVAMTRGSYNSVFQYYNKDAKSWESFDPRYKEDDYRSRAAALTDISTFFGEGFSALVQLGAGGATGQGLKVFSVVGFGSASADAALQIANSSKATLSEKIQDINLTSVGLSAIRRNPLASAFVGSAFEYKLSTGFQTSYFFGGGKDAKSLKNVFIETTLGTVFGAVGGKAEKYLGLDDMVGAAKETLNKNGAVTLKFAGSGTNSTLIGQLNFMITELLKDSTDDKVKDKN